jgi:hypothetical protein
MPVMFIITFLLVCVIFKVIFVFRLLQIFVHFKGAYDVESVNNGLDQGSANYGPRAASGLGLHFMQPAKDVSTF